MSDFKRLKVWRKAHSLALSVRRVARSIRGADNASLRNQLIRAAMSIPTNIVEGTGQKTGKEFARFIGIALNSASELEYHLMMARDDGVIKTNDVESLLSRTIEVRKMLHGLQNAVLAFPRMPKKPVPTS
ncbi:MAG TPA: four helix bundle protein [Gemmatimonadaceae bacterium]